MKKLFVLISLSTFLFSSAAFAQQQQPQANIGCMDKTIIVQAHGLMQAFKNQGMEIYKDAMVTMRSETPFPIAVQLDKGTLYQFIFVGSLESSKTIMELYDGDDKKIAQKALKKGEQPGYIIYSFIPDKTDMYLIVLSQKWKNKSMCGSFSIMQQPNKNAPAADVDKSKAGTNKK
ncbi:MAG TPA: hypothetical protein VN721_06455 [Flavipsychrobacter sp.]|nr:hypothetical protein [Flavipsychrobacter sp.]